MTESLTGVIRTLTAEANKANRKWNNPESDLRASAYYSGYEDGLRRALETLRRKSKKEKGKVRL